MNETNLIYNYKKNNTVPVENVAKDDENIITKSKSIQWIIENTVHRAECGAVIKIAATGLLEPE